jgi:hypothetical protein
MQCHRPINIKNFSTIQHSIRNAIEIHGFDSVRSCLLKKEFCLESINGLKESLMDLNLIDIFQSAWLMKLNSFSTLGIHVDQSDKIDRVIAINIPISNTKNTYMKWYDQVVFQRYLSDHVYGTFPSFYTERISDVFLDRLELLSPAICRIDLPHNVENQNHTTRIILSLNFDKLENRIDFFDGSAPIRYDVDSFVRNSAYNIIAAPSGIKSQTL